MSTNAFVLYCTCPDSAQAERIAAWLVSTRLAACVSLLPGVKSFYCWDGRLCEDEEVLLMIKTTGPRLHELQQRLRAEHPYEIPELIALPVVFGLPDYLEWLHTCTATPAPTSAD